MTSVMELDELIDTVDDLRATPDERATAARELERIFDEHNVPGECLFERWSTLRHRYYVIEFILP